MAKLIKHVLNTKNCHVMHNLSVYFSNSWIYGYFCIRDRQQLATRF